MIQEGKIKTDTQRKQDFNTQFDNLLMAKNKVEMIKQGKIHG